MLAIHDRFTEEMRNRLETTCMGLGLVRLLQDARQLDEAKRTLSLLEYGCKDVVEQSNKANRVKGVTKSAAIKNDAAEILPQPLSLA